MSLHLKLLFCKILRTIFLTISTTYLPKVLRRHIWAIETMFWIISKLWADDLLFAKMFSLAHKTHSNRSCTQR